MKRVLLISYYSLPLNAVSSYRVQAFFDVLRQEGLHVTLVTRHWESKYSNWSDAMRLNTKEMTIVEYENGRKISLPYNVSTKIYSNNLINKITYLLKYLNGNLQPEIDTYTAFYPFLSEYLKTNKYDIMIGSMPPNNTVKLLYHLNKMHKIPYVLDFRDFFNSYLFDSSAHINLSENGILHLSLFWLKKWGSKATFNISISAPFSKKIKHFFKIKTITITNGYEEEIFKNITKIQNSIFTIRYIGSCSIKQDFQTFIDAFNIFSKDKSKVRIELIGTMNQEIEDLFTSQIDTAKLNIISQRLDKKEVAELTCNSDLLLFPSWATHKGVYSTKIFDYLASEVPIMVIKSDKDVVAELIKETSCGEIFESTSDIVHYLNNQYLEWSEKGYVFSKSNKETTIKYSREYQTKLLAQEIKGYQF